MWFVEAFPSGKGEQEKPKEQFHLSFFSNTLLMRQGQQDNRLKNYRSSFMILLLLK